MLFGASRETLGAWMTISNSPILSSPCAIACTNRSLNSILSIRHYLHIKNHKLSLQQTEPPLLNPFELYNHKSLSKPQKVQTLLSPLGLSSLQPPAPEPHAKHPHSERNPRIIKYPKSPLLNLSKSSLFLKTFPPKVPQGRFPTVWGLTCIRRTICLLQIPTTLFLMSDPIGMYNLAQSPKNTNFRSRICEGHHHNSGAIIPLQLWHFTQASSGKQGQTLWTL